MPQLFDITGTDLQVTQESGEKSAINIGPIKATSTSTNSETETLYSYTIPHGVAKYSMCPEDNDLLRPL